MSRYMPSIDKHKLFGGKTERKTKNVSCCLTVVKYTTYVADHFQGAFAVTCEKRIWTSSCLSVSVRLSPCMKQLASNFNGFLLNFLLGISPKICSENSFAVKIERK